MRHSRILISGAGIAGPCLGYWLAKHGFSVTIVEKAADLRTGGQNIDIRGPGVDVIKRMGLERAIRAASTREEGLVFVDDDNRVEAQFPSTGDDSFTAEFEILRSDLARIFFEATRNDVEYRFGVTIESLTQDADRVRVGLSKGDSEDFDLVIAADGVGSGTREKIIGSGDYYHYLGLYTAYVTIPKAPCDTQWARWHNAPGGKVFLLRPDNKGTTRASITFLADIDPNAPRTREQEIAMVERALDGAGWESDRLRAALRRDEDLYIGPLSQVHAPRWHRGRCALLGDAAYCPTPISGAGTTLAIVGAHVLAGELGRAADYTTAFENYERIMRPVVEQRQKLPPGVPRLAYPKTAAGIFVLNKLARLASTRPAKKVLGWMSAH